MTSRRTQRPRPHLFTQPVRATMRDIGLTLAGLLVLALMARVLEVFPFLIGG